uniref:Nuclear receptor domain-containing protein n=1 Tax=Elaeophora elaphi TaxID=1147741 RepID=A0A0R3RGD0_9BILA
MLQETTMQATAKAKLTTVASETNVTAASEETLLTNDKECPTAVDNCILMKTKPFMEHCTINCLAANGKLSNELHCWNDNCFIRATRICEEKFWKTVPIKNRKKKKKRMHCITEIKHCYKLACLKCLGRECNINCYGAGIQYTYLTKPRWKGYDEYRKFFPEVEDILHKLILVPEKTVTIEDTDE